MGRLAPIAPRRQSRRGGLDMGDSVGTYGAGLWLERVESALYTALLDAVGAGDHVAAEKWVRLLERLSIV